MNTNSLPARKTLLTQYLARTDRTKIVVQAHNTRKCGLVFSSTPPTVETMALNLMKETTHGYVIHNGSLYYVSEHSQTIEVLIDNEPGRIQEIEKQVCVNENENTYLLPSQLSRLSQMSDHMSTETMCELKIEEGAIQYRFYHDSWRKLPDDSPPHPVLSLIFDSIESYLAKSDSGFRRQTSMVSANQMVSKITTDRFSMPKRTFLQTLGLPFHWLNQALKSILSLLFLDNFIIKHTIGRVIAAIANHGNPHYTTEPETVSGILGPIIFPGGFKKPHVSEEGVIYLDQIVSAQYGGLLTFENRRNPATNTIEDQGIQYTEYSVPMASGGTNNGIEGVNELAQRRIDAGDGQKILYVLTFTGNGECYQSNLGDMTHLLKAYNDAGVPVKLIGFNYPGVLSSHVTSKNAQSLIEYGIAQVDRLQKLGIPLDNIFLHGISLGGSIATHVASFYHQRGETLGGLHVSSTFSSTTNVGLSYIERVPYVGRVLAFLLRPILAFGLWGTSWQLDTAKHYAALPEQRKHYNFTKTPDIIHRAYHKQGKSILDDEVISYGASLHRSWRLRFKRWCIRQLGLFGYDQANFQTMIENRKMIPVLIATAQGDKDLYSAELSHKHCAHVDIDKSSSQSSAKHMLTLLTRTSTDDMDRGVSISTHAQTKTGERVHILSSGENLMDNAAVFAQYRAQQTGLIEAQANKFNGFFEGHGHQKNSHDLASDVTQNVLNWIP